MRRLRKYGGIALLLLALVMVAQIGVSLFLKSHRMRGYLIAHLQSAFGRPVQAGDFSIQLLPMPELDVDAITIGEDPAFGREYFLRAERMTASFRWSGLLRGHFEFGTMSLTRPSLILVRKGSGRWNLEDWLPPAGAKAGDGPVSRGSQPPPAPTHLLQKIEFDDGRINFKFGDEKRPFAFTGVSGSVEQVSAGRWQLRLKAQPWRSGVMLQSTGTLDVAGDVAGTSARLQPAQIRVHWDKASLADLFRLITGNDSGVRGEFALDGSARVGTGASGAGGEARPWEFQLRARSAQIHRWDLAERSDNPRLNVNVSGSWNLATSEVRADELRVELPHSDMAGSAVLRTDAPNSWRGQLKSIHVQGEDLLAWGRAFQPDIADEVALEDSIAGSLTVSGWPLKWEEGAMTGARGALRVPGLKAIRIDPFRGSVRNGKFGLEAFRLRFVRDVAGEKPEKKLANPRAAAAPEDAIEVSLDQDAVGKQGGLRLNLLLADAAPLFKLTAAFGHAMNSGWEYSGGVSGSVGWNWGSSIREAHRSGSIELAKAQLQVAGLNRPLQIGETRLEWKDGMRSAAIGKAEAFGAAWSGTIAESSAVRAGGGANWNFQLHADRLDAGELDRWFGPRARPNWLQRLLPSLLGGAGAARRASELLRQVSAEGGLTVDALTIEKIKLAKAHATLSLHNLSLQVKVIDAQWAGGNVRGEMQARFWPVPKYEMNAEIERVNLAQLPWPPRWAERWNGTASGKVHLTTGGVGREDLLNQLAGQGTVQFHKVELRGWDMESSAESGTLRPGTARWASGQGEFQIVDRRLHLAAMELDAPHQRTELSGSIGFDMTGDLKFRPAPWGKRGAKSMNAAHELRLNGPLEAPKATVQPAAAANE